MYRLTIILLCSLTIYACTTAPQPKRFEQLGRFSNYPLDDQVYRIHFHIPDDMNYATADEITLIKSAQITIQQGFQYFKVLKNDRTVVQSHQIIMTDLYDPFGYDGFTTYIRDDHTSDIIYHIHMYHKDNQPKDSFDAHLILKTLGSKYTVSTIDTPTAITESKH